MAAAMAAALALAVAVAIAVDADHIREGRARGVNHVLRRQIVRDAAAQLDTQHAGVHRPDIKSELVK